MDRHLAKIQQGCLSPSLENCTQNTSNDCGILLNEYWGISDNEKETSLINLAPN